MDHTKPQRSTFWIFATLWVMIAIINIGLNTIFGAVLAGLTQVVNIPAILFDVLKLAVSIGVLWISVRIAVKYVLKKTIVFKRDAHKFALLVITVPLLLSVIFFVSSFSESDLKDFARDAVSIVIGLGYLYYLVRSLLAKYGNEQPLPLSTKESVAVREGH